MWPEMAARPPRKRVIQVMLAVASWSAAMTAAVVLFTHHRLLGVVCAVLLLAAAGWALDAFVPAVGRGAVFRGRPSRDGTPRVALTFDDGPAPDTLAVLDALRRAQVRATFFMLGRHAQQRPELVRAVVDSGHVVGNHTYSHRVLALSSPRTIAAEIDRTQKILVDAGAPTPRFFRAPRGFQGPLVRHVLKRRRLTLVGWTRGAWDSERRTARAIADAAAANPRDGDILLLHDGAGTPGETRRERTAEAIVYIVKTYRDRGFQFVTLSELLDA